MTNKILTAALMSTAIVAGSAAFAMTEVQSVNVTVDLEAIENERAAQYWTTVADDLETAIVSRLTDQIVETNGASVSVDIIQDQSEREFYELTVDYDQAISFLPTADGDIVAVSMGDKAYYDGMIEAFADNVVSKLQ